MVALGAYHALRDLQWDCAALPAEPEDIRRIAAVQPREWRVAWPLLCSHFPIDSDGRRRNQQLAAQRYEAVGKRWQQIDAINLRHHRDDGAYLGATADAYLKQYTDVTSSVRTTGHSDVHTHQHEHQLRKAYDGGGMDVGESLRSAGRGS